jgi:hypothetical protein
LCAGGRADHGTRELACRARGELRRQVTRVARRSGALVYGAHTLEDPSTRVFVHTVDSAPREVYRDPGVGSIADVTDDDTRALYVRARSGTDHILFAVDLVIANEGHGVTRRETIIAYLARSYRFLADHLALPPRT